MARRLCIPRQRFWPVEMGGYKGASPMLDAMGFTTLLNARTNTIHPSVTASRAGPGMVQNEAGEWVMQTNATGGGTYGPRRTYDPATGEYDFMAYGQVTNEVSDSETFGVEGLNNGVAYSHVGSGCIGNLRYQDVRCHGTVDSQGWSNCGAIGSVLLADPSVTYTSSLYAQIISDSGPISVELVWITRNSSWGVAPYDSTSSLSSAPKRYECLSAPYADRVYFFPTLHIQGGTGAAVDCVIRVWGVKRETGTVATPPIPTYGAQATCAADVWEWDNQILTDAGGTVVARMQGAPTQGPSRAVLSGDPNYEPLAIQYGGYISSWDGVNSTQASAVDYFSATNTAVSSWGSGKTMLASSGAEVVTAYDGSIVGSTIAIGNNNATSNPLQGTINHLSVAPAQRSADERAQLAAITRF